MMAQNTDAGRNRAIRRLNESGFKPQTIDQILQMIDAMMTGHATLAHVLVAATEVCRACDLDETHRHVAKALECLAAEVMQYQDAFPDDPSGAVRRTRFGVT
jgi:hypothetical protein